MIRRLTYLDLTERFEDFKTLLGQLTDVSGLTPDNATMTFAYINSSEKKTVFVYENNKMLVGTVSLIFERKFAHFPKNKVCHLEDLAVLPEYQNKGIGSRLVAYAVNYAKDIRCYKVILDCDDSKKEFYERNGFIDVGNSMRFEL